MNKNKAILNHLAQFIESHNFAHQSVKTETALLIVIKAPFVTKVCREVIRFIMPEMLAPNVVLWHMVAKYCKKHPYKTNSNTIKSLSTQPVTDNMMQRNNTGCGG